jgi:hypothetical protein
VFLRAQNRQWMEGIPIFLSVDFDRLPAHAVDLPSRRGEEIARADDVGRGVMNQFRDFHFPTPRVICSFPAQRVSLIVVWFSP